MKKTKSDDDQFKDGAAAALDGLPCDAGATAPWTAGWRSVTKEQKAEYAKLKKKAHEGIRAWQKFRWANPLVDHDQPRRAGLLGGRPKGTVQTSDPRCKCGLMPLARAKKAGHACKEIADMSPAERLKIIKAMRKDGVTLREISGKFDITKQRVLQILKPLAPTGRPVGRPKAERCGCGAMTATRAKARGHKCEG